MISVEWLGVAQTVAMTGSSREKLAFMALDSPIQLDMVPLKNEIRSGQGISKSQQRHAVTAAEIDHRVDACGNGQIPDAGKTESGKIDHIVIGLAEVANLIGVVSGREHEGIGELQMQASFDSESGHLVELVMPGSNIAGAPVREKRLFSEFDERGLPAKENVYHDDALAATITIKKWNINDALAPELFDRLQEPEP